MDGEDAGANEHPQLEHLAGGLPDRHPGRPGGEPHTGLTEGPLLGSCPRRRTRRTTRSRPRSSCRPGKELPLLDNTTAKNGPCASILALRRALVTQIEGP